MKRQIQTMGVRKYFGADLIELQSEPLKALDAFFAEHGPCIVQGCEITIDDGGRYNIAAGMVALMATDTEGARRVMVMPFDGASSLALPLYLRAQPIPIERGYGDGKLKPIAYSYFAVATDIAPDDGMPSLVLTSENGNRFMDAMQDSEHRFVTDIERTQWNAISEEMNEGLATKAALVPHSLTEQIVPGEFWIGTDGVSRQVYQQTFLGTFAADTGYIPLKTNCREFVPVVAGFLSSTNSLYMPWGVIEGDGDRDFLFYFWANNDALALLYPLNSVHFVGSKYSITMKYTKIN